MLRSGERAVRIGREEGERHDGLNMEESSLGDGGAAVNTNLDGLKIVLVQPSTPLDFLGDVEKVGSMFSVSLSRSKESALRLVGEEDDMAISWRLEICLILHGRRRFEKEYAFTILSILQTG